MSFPQLDALLVWATFTDLMLLAVLCAVLLLSLLTWQNGRRSSNQMYLVTVQVRSPEFSGWRLRHVICKKPEDLALHLFEQYYFADGGVGHGMRGIILNVLPLPKQHATVLQNTIEKTGIRMEI